MAKDFESYGEENGKKKNKNYKTDFTKEGI